MPLYFQIIVLQRLNPTQNSSYHGPRVAPNWKDDREARGFPRVHSCRDSRGRLGGCF